MAVLALAGCRAGIHTYQSRTTSTQELTYQETGEPDSPVKRMGTSDSSQRLHGLDMSGRVMKAPVQLELGYTLGFSDPHVGETSGDVPAPMRETEESGWHPEDISVYDALFATVGGTFATVDGVRLSAYGKASAIAFARLVRSTSGPTFMLEGGIEAALPVSTETSIYLRVGYQVERTEVRYDVPYLVSLPESGGQLVGSQTFTGLTAGMGVFWDGLGR